MLRIYRVILDMIAELAPVVDEIEKRDSSLAKQTRDALSSLALNTADGMGNIDGHKRQRYQTALGSAREGLCGLHVAVAMRTIEPIDPATLDHADHVIATLVKLVCRRG